MHKQLHKKHDNRAHHLRVLAVSVLLLVLGVFFLVTTFGSRQFGPFHKIMMEIVGPVQKTVTRTGSALDSIKHDYIDSIQNFFKLNEEKKPALWSSEAQLNSDPQSSRRNGCSR